MVDTDLQLEHKGFVHCESSSTKSLEPSHDAKKSKKRSRETEMQGRWTPMEHALFLQALQEHGKDWEKVHALVQTRSLSQIRSHAQKHFLKLSKQREFERLVESESRRWNDMKHPATAPSCHAFEMSNAKESVSGKSFVSDLTDFEEDPQTMALRVLDMLCDRLLWLRAERTMMVNEEAQEAMEIDERKEEKEEEEKEMEECDREDCEDIEELSTSSDGECFLRVKKHVSITCCDTLCMEKIEKDLYLEDDGDGDETDRDCQTVSSMSEDELNVNSYYLDYII